MTAPLYAGEWQAAGACLSADPEIFFPVSGTGASVSQIEQARQICAQCPVRRECLDFAMSSGETHGIWGGTTPEDRTRARRQEAARRRHARRSWPSAPGTRAGGSPPDSRLLAGHDLAVTSQRSMQESSSTGSTGLVT